MAADATVTMRYNADTTAAQSSLTNFGSVIKKVGSIMAAVFSLKAIYDIGAAFEESFAKASTLIDESSVSLSALKDNVLDLSNDSGVAADEINEGLYQALSAGVDITEDGADALEYMDGMLKLAEGGFTDTATAVDATTTIMNAYGLSQEDAMKVSDQLIATQNKGKTTVAQLGSSLSQVIPIAAQLGMEYDQVGASLAALTLNGDSTSEAATKMKALLKELGQSSSEAGQSFERVAGQSFTQFIDSGGTVSEALAMMQDYADDTGVGVSELFSSIEAGSAAATLASKEGLTNFDESLDSIRNSSGATDAAFKKMTETASYKMQKAFNKLKNVGIKVFGALAPVITLVADVIGVAADVLETFFSGFKKGTILSKILAAAILAIIVAIAAYNIYMEIMTATTLASAMANKALMGSMGALAIIAIAMTSNLEDMSVGMKILISIIVLVVAAFAVLKVSAMLTGTAIAAAMGPALLPILAIIAAVAALIAIFSIFSGDTETSKKIREDTKAMKEEREAVDDTVAGLDSAANASKEAAKQLVGLSKKFKSGKVTVSQMQSQVDELNDAFGENVVSVDESTGVIKIYGEEVENAEEVLDGMIDLQNAQAKASEYQGKLNDANSKKTEALTALEQEQADTLELTAEEHNAYVEQLSEADESIKVYTQIMEDANAVIDEETQKMEERNIARGNDIMGQEAYNMAIEQLNSERELTTAEHNERLQELVNSNFAELGMTEEEYIAEMAEHQQAIQEATQAHVDTLFGINEEGLYNEAHSVEELNAIWSKNQEDMANYYSNLNTLSEAGFDELATIFEDGGVEMGGDLQNTMDDLQGIGLDGWKEIQADWEANGGKLSAGVKEKYGDINVEAGLGVLELAETTKKGFEDAPKYATNAMDLMVDGTEETMDNVNDAVEAGGEEVAETSGEAGEGATDTFVDGAEKNQEEVVGIGLTTGQNYVKGLIAGLNSMKWTLKMAAISLAIAANTAYKNTLDINSPSRVARWNMQMYGKGAEQGLEDSEKGVKAKAADLANTVIDASKLVYTPPFMGSASTASTSYNYYSNQTDARQDGPSIAIENYYQNSEQDQQDMANKLETSRIERAMAIGAKI